jgi:UDP-3-O-acyl-N-acetylglucosamine deacetylase
MEMTLRQIEVPVKIQKGSYRYLVESFMIDKKLEIKFLIIKGIKHKEYVSLEKCTVVQNTMITMWNTLTCFYSETDHFVQYKVYDFMGGLYTLGGPGFISAIVNDLILEATSSCFVLKNKDGKVIASFSPGM